jgi:single-strand DNA-binding protein
VLPIVTVEGRMVNDPELRFSPSGVAVGKFRIVASSRKKDESGEWVDDKTLWMQVTCFKQLAENCVDSLGKGDLVVVTGRLQTDEWESEGGEKRSATVLVANNVGPSLMFRSTPHGERRTERTTERSTDDQWSAPTTQPEDPPF